MPLQYIDLDTMRFFHSLSFRLSVEPNYEFLNGFRHAELQNRMLQMYRDMDNVKSFCYP